MEKLKFTVDSALLSELGEKLVESVHIALLELVKNAFDADATKVYIEILSQKDEAPIIKISDNGSGMTLDGVKKYWMKIATHHKAIDRLSEIYHRPKTGSKGIGRFAVRRLGRHLKLTTIAKAKDVYEKTEIEFNWDKFVKGKDIGSIKCDCSMEKLNSARTGTVLVISGAIDNQWNQKGYDYLKRQLALLVANKPLKRKGSKKEDPGFNIFLRAPGFDSEKVVDLREELMKAGWCMLTGQVDTKGTATFNIEAKGLGERSITSTKSFPSLTGVNFTIGLIVDVSKESNRNPKLLAKYSIKEILKSWGGVQIRYNSFRVYPYGEEHDDWLKIDHDRGLRKAKSISKQLDEIAISLKNVDKSRYLLNLLSNRNHIGWVDIDERAQGFEMKASREGFLNSNSVDELRELVRFGIDWITLLRDYYLRIKAKDDVELSRQKLEILTKKPVAKDEIVAKAVEYLNDQLEHVAEILPKKDSSRLKKSFSDVAKTIVSANQSNRNEIQHLRLIASAATLLPVFAHEVKSFVGGIDVNCGQLEILEQGLPASKAKEVKKVREALEGTQKRFIDLLELTSLVGVESKNDTPQRLALRDRIEVALNCFQLILSKSGIDVDYDEVGNDLLVGPLLEAELYAILLNSLSNAIKAVIAGVGVKKIKISGRKEGKNFFITMLDSGIGLAKENFEDVFVPFVADPQNKLYNQLKRNINPEDQAIVGSGSGLGLSIVKEIVSSRNGSIRFVEPDQGWKTKLEIQLS